MMKSKKCIITLSPFSGEG